MKRTLIGNVPNASNGPITADMPIPDAAASSPGDTSVRTAAMEQTIVE